MNIRSFIILCFLCVAAFGAYAYEELPARYDGSMMPLNLTEAQSLREVAPDSLKPVMINYVARHGARYLSSAKKISVLRSAFKDAEKARTITDRGRRFILLLDSVEAVTANRWGALNTLGKEEQQVLATQMRDLCPELMSHGSVQAIATYVPRVVMSMYEFCHTLCRLSPNLEINTAEGKRFSPLLRYFDTDPAYSAYLKNGDWKEVCSRYQEEIISTEPARRLLGGCYGKDSKRYRELTMAIYGVLQSLRAASLPAPGTEWMSVKEYEQCWRVANLEHCLRRTSTSLSSLPAQSAKGLLSSIIASLDSAGMPKSPVAILRFGHAETLMPLFDLMKLPGCVPAPKTPYDEIYKSWRDYEVVPLAANLLIVTLRGASGKLYICMRLNGRWVAPLSNGRKVIPYTELKAFWQAITE